MPLIEKAFAKLHGSFHAIESGTSAEALGLLTGLPTRALDDIHKRGGEKSMSDDALFAQLRSWHSAGFILCAACGHTDRPVPEFKSLGLKHAHAYAPVEILQNTFSDRTRCMAQLRARILIPAECSAIP